MSQHPNARLTPRGRETLVSRIEAGAGVAEAARVARREAERRQLPPYMVLHGRTLAAIAKKRPTTEAELALIPGMGEIKRAKYAEAILDIVRAHERPTTPDKQATGWHMDR